MQKNLIITIIIAIASFIFVGIGVAKADTPMSLRETDSKMFGTPDKANVCFVQLPNQPNDQGIYESVLQFKYGGCRESRNTTGVGTYFTAPGEQAKRLGIYIPSKSKYFVQSYEGDLIKITNDNVTLGNRIAADTNATVHATQNDVAVVKTTTASTEAKVDYLTTVADHTDAVVSAAYSRDVRIAECRAKVTKTYGYEAVASVAHTGIEGWCKGDCKKGNAISGGISDILRIKIDRDINKCESIR